VAALIGGQAVEHRVVRRALQVAVQRGVDAQPAFMHLVAAVLGFEVAADLFNKIRRKRSGVMRQLQADRPVAEIVGLLGGDLAVLEHGVDDQIAPLDGALRMIDRRVVLRRLGKPRQ